MDTNRRGLSSYKSSSRQRRILLSGSKKWPIFAKIGCFPPLFAPVLDGTVEPTSLHSAKISQHKIQKVSCLIVGKSVKVATFCLANLYLLFSKFTASGMKINCS
jgi:hypothetical protein